MIAITTPTGNIGKRVVERCLGASEPVRLIARDPSKLPADVRERVEVVQGSHGDPTVIDQALKGAGALFWLVPPEPRDISLEEHYVGFTRPAAEAIKRQGIRHVVDVKAIAGSTRWAESAGLATASQHMSDVLAATGANLRSLPAPAIMDNMLMQLKPITEQGVFFGPMDPDQKVPQVAARDIAATAARFLLDRSWTGQADVPVLGPEDISFDEVAATMAEVLGRPVRYQQVSMDDFAKQLRGRGMPETFVQGFVDMMKAKDEGMDNVPTRTAASTTPTTFRQWCEEELAKAARIALT